MRLPIKFKYTSLRIPINCNSVCDLVYIRFMRLVCVYMLISRYVRLIGFYWQFWFEIKAVFQSFIEGITFFLWFWFDFLLDCGSSAVGFLSFPFYSLFWIGKSPIPNPKICECKKAAFFTGLAECDLGRVKLPHAPICSTLPPIHTENMERKKVKKLTLIVWKI